MPFFTTKSTNKKMMNAEWKKREEHEKSISRRGRGDAEKRVRVFFNAAGGGIEKPLSPASRGG